MADSYETKFKRMAHCQYCRRIDFGSLPSEEEDALPHQPSLDALKASSNSCTICELILWAAGCSLANPGGMMAYKPNVRYPSGRQIMTEVVESNYSGLGIIRGFENGAVSISTSNPEPDLRPPETLDLDTYFPDGSAIRPWLFGSLYRSPFQDKSHWLVGLGVRLGTGPGVEDAEGNSVETINRRGTFLRIRTDDGTPPLPTEAVSIAASNAI